MVNVIVVVPPVPPVTTPVVEPTIAIVVLLLIHVPPPVASDKFVVNPTQTFVEPVIAAGLGCTVSTKVA